MQCKHQSLQESSGYIYNNKKLHETAYDKNHARNSVQREESCWAYNARRKLNTEESERKEASKSKSLRQELVTIDDLNLK